MLAVVAAPAQSDRQPDEATPRYELREPSRDGTGRVYMGREISEVMGHRGAAWLERDRREQEEAPARLLGAIDLRPHDRVADIGAGTGYFTFRISPLVPQGTVFAVDIQQEMLDVISRRMAKLQADNIVPVLGTITDPRLADESIDVALLVDAYHEFSHPFEMMSALRRALRPNGRLILVEYRGEDPEVPIKPLHKMTEAQARKEMSAVGLEWVETIDVLPRQHIMVFRK